MRRQRLYPAVLHELGPLGRQIPGTLTDRTLQALALVERWARTGDERRSAVSSGESVLRSVLLSSGGRGHAEKIISAVLALSGQRREALSGKAVPVPVFAELASVPPESEEVLALAKGDKIPGLIGKRLLGSSGVSLRARAVAGLPLTGNQLDFIAGKEQLARAEQLFRRRGQKVRWGPGALLIGGTDAAQILGAVEVMDRLHWRCGHPGCREEVAFAALCRDHARQLAAGEQLSPRRNAPPDVYVLSPLMMKLMAEGKLKELGHRCLRPGCHKEPDDMMLVVCKKHFREWQQTRPPAELLLPRLQRGKARGSGSASQPAHSS